LCVFNHYIDSPWVPSPEGVPVIMDECIRSLLKTESIKFPVDIVDVGCGDGRVLRRLVSLSEMVDPDYIHKCLGVEINGELLERGKKEYSHEKISLVLGDVFEAIDFHEGGDGSTARFIRSAHVLYLCLLPEMMESLAPILHKILRDDVHIFSYLFHLEKNTRYWKLVRKHSVDGVTNVYQYVKRVQND